jgi:ATP-binding cassette, subfamily F, member 3
MCRSDLLLLDEPTNHLDLDAVIWLEGWLRPIRARCC